MVYFSKHQRSTQEELMDDFSLQGNDLQGVLNDLETVNTYLGGNKITIKGLEKMLSHCDKQHLVTIVDYGCGDGASLVLCAAYLEKHDWKYHLIGVDANEHILKKAKDNCSHIKECTFNQINVFNARELPQADIALCTLFLHHFKDDLVKKLLANITAKTKVGIVINDLQRSKLAFRLFKAFSAVFLTSHIAKFDGLVSIARSFIRKDILYISEALENTTFEVNSKWAFRWEWLIYNNSTNSQ